VGGEKRHSLKTARIGLSQKSLFLHIYAVKREKHDAKSLSRFGVLGFEPSAGLCFVVFLYS